MATLERTAYPRFPQVLAPRELQACYTPLPAARELGNVVRTVSVIGGCSIVGEIRLEVRPVIGTFEGKYDLVERAVDKHAELIDCAGVRGICCLVHPNAIDFLAGDVFCQPAPRLVSTVPGAS